MKAIMSTISSDPTCAALPVSGYSVMFQQKVRTRPSLVSPKSSCIAFSFAFSCRCRSPSASCSHTCPYPKMSTTFGGTFDNVLRRCFSSLC